MRRGWTVAWCGWQWDVLRSAALMGLEAPQAVEDGQPIDGMMSLEFQPNGPDKDKLLANRVHRPYPAADLNDPNAELTVRDWPGGERTTIPRERWRFARDEGGRPVPDANYLWLEGGFEAGKIYEIVFRTSDCPVVGTGLLAVRDFRRSCTTAPPLRATPAPAASSRPTATASRRAAASCATSSTSA